MPHMSQREIIPTHSREGNAKTGGLCSYKPRNIDSHLKPEESRKGFSPRASRGSVALTMS